MSDNGKCLSMHQPWASLLVRGIKQHEGRSWYSAHRGRLWIAATAKEVDPEEIAALEDFYREYHGGSLNFPDEYPSACLLGSVDVGDVMAQDDYAEEFPDGESQSPSLDQLHASSHTPPPGKGAVGGCGGGDGCASCSHVS